MADLERTAEALRQRGYTVTRFETGAQAADYLDTALDGKTIGFGGSMTLAAMGLWERLTTHNTVYSHLHGFPMGPEAAGAQVYITSANGLAETGEIINIDGYGNRISGTLFGHEKVIFVIGSNKIAPDYDQALWRARNIAGPKNAQRRQMKTPCAVKADRCYDCKSPDRICHGLTVLWGPMMGMETEVILLDEELGF